MADQQWAALVSEIQSDPLARGYAGMSDAQVLASLNTVDRDNWQALTGSEIVEAIDVTEYKALSVVNRDAVDMVVSSGDAIQTAPGSNARAIFIDAFGGGSTTITVLAAIANPQQSRAQELGISGYVTAYRVGQARA